MLSLVDADGVLLDPHRARPFRLPVLTGITRSEGEALRRERMKRFLRMQSRTWARTWTRFPRSMSAKSITSKSFSSSTTVALTLMLGNQSYRERYENFIHNHDEIRNPVARCNHAGSAPEGSHYGCDHCRRDHDSGSKTMSGPLRYAVGLDVGSAHTRCLVCVLEDSRMRYLGHSNVPSGGWSKGRISDQVAATDSIRAAVTEAERRAQVSVEGAVVGVGGTSIEGMNSRGLYEFGRPREIDPGDLNYAVELASKVRLTGRSHRASGCAAGFHARRPRRLSQSARSRLRAARSQRHVVSTSVHEHQALVNAVHHAHLAVEETIFEPVAAAYSAVLADERSRGVAIVDIGAHSTDLVVYDGDALLRASSIPISADHFTRDMAIGLTVTYEDAERLKRDYGCAVMGLTSESSLIELPSPDGRAPREAPRTFLNDILEARAQELFHFVRGEIAKVGMEQALLEGVVLTGGGALLQGMCDVAEERLNCQARNGLPVGIAGLPDEINDPAWCVAAGLSMYSAKLKTRKEWKRTVPGILGLLYDKGMTGGQHGGN